MVASIGVISSAGKGVYCYERDGHYARDDPAYREASAWAGKDAQALNLSDAVEPQSFEKILEGYVPDGSVRHLDKKREGSIHHCPGCDVTLSAPKSVSHAAPVGGDRRIAADHNKVVKRTLAWVEKNVLETRVMDADSKTMDRRRDQEMVAATFRKDTSRNLDPQLNTNAVIANMLQGGDGKWRTMANERLYRSKMLIGALYRSELARELKGLGYGLYKTHADGRFEIRGVSREVLEAFPTRRTEIKAAMQARGAGKVHGPPRDGGEGRAQAPRAQGRPMGGGHGSIRTAVKPRIPLSGPSRLRRIAKDRRQSSIRPKILFRRHALQ
ncbi:MAG: conjugative relaxase [Rhodospirillaceae bacterium]|nr:conjugative relaxase [Rhodospirillaceae bacterium]MDE0361917.1 conjugative relaxase [Rhodospirillaceae bacterium]